MQDHHEILEGEGNSEAAEAFPLDKFAVTFNLPKKVEDIDMPVPHMVFEWFNDEFVDHLQTIYPKFTEAVDTLEAEGVDKSSVEWAERAQQRLQDALQAEQKGEPRKRNMICVLASHAAILGEMVERPTRKKLRLV